MKKNLWLVLLLCLSMTLSACGQKQGIEPEVTEPVTEENQQEIQEVNEHYPVTIENYDGTGERVEQVFEKAPERIVSNQPQAIQLLLALGLKEKIVGACRSVGDVNEKYLDEFNSLNFISENDSPAKEVVLDQNPDIIIGWGSTFGENTLGSVKDWHDKGIHTYLVENSVAGEDSRTLDRIYKDIENLGKIFDVEEKASKMIEDMKSKQSNVEDKVSQIAEEDRVKVLTVQMVYENEFYARSRRDLTTDLITRAGAISLDDEGGKQSIENLIAINPDVLLIINRIDSPAQEKIEALKANKSLANVDAIKDERFISVDYVDFYGGNYETMNTVERLAEGFYPDLFK
jgi:iron complex transport system substrate-binding protein